MWGVELQQGNGGKNSTCVKKSQQQLLVPLVHLLNMTKQWQINRKTLDAGWKYFLWLKTIIQKVSARIGGGRQGRGWGHVSGAAVDGTAHWCIYLLVKRRAVFISDLRVMLEVRGYMALGLLLYEQAKEDWLRLRTALSTLYINVWWSGKTLWISVWLKNMVLTIFYFLFLPI